MDKVTSLIVLAIILAACTFVGTQDYADELERERDDLRAQVELLRSNLALQHARAACMPTLAATDRR
jgi:hypothetical protein